MKHSTFMRGLAVFAAAGTLAAAVPVTFSASAATKDISDTMEWDALRIGGGGFVSGIVTGKKVMYARTDVGGAYRYNYETESWEQLLGFLNEADRGLLSVDAMAVDPTDDNTVYFLCGCAYFSAEKTVIFKTTDGGKTMKEIDVTNLIKVMGNGDGRQCGESIAVDPDNPKVIYAGGDVTSDEKSKSALIKSTDGGETWEPVIGYDDLGLFDKTTKWPTWTENIARCTVEGAYNNQNGVANIVISGGKVYVGTSKTGTANVHVASTKDDKFTVLSKDLPTDVFPSRLIADANGNIIVTYMAALAFGGMSGGAYRYDVKGGTVTNIAPVEKGFGEIYPDPANPDRLVATTCGVWASQMYSEDAWDRDAVAWGDQFYRSEDGGKTWRGITPGVQMGWQGPLEADYIKTGGYDWIYDKAIHWVGSMVIDPRNPDRAFLTSGNGSFVCTDLWSDLPTYTFHPDGIEEVVSLDFVSTADGLDLSAIGDYDGFVHSAVRDIPPQYKPNMGSTSAIAVCPQNTDVWARTANGDGNNTGSAYYTLDRGKTWTAFTPACTGGKLSITELKKGSYRIINSSANGAVSYSDDFGKTWNKCDGIQASKTVHTLVDPENPARVYASGVQYNDYWASDMSKTEPTLEESHYGFYVSDDYGATFTKQITCRYDMCDSSGDPAYVAKDTVAVAAGWYGMYLTTDGGKTLNKLDTVFYAKTVGYGAPEKTGGPNTLYIYGKPLEEDVEGIYRSTDMGKTWVCINTKNLYGGTGNGNYLVGDMDEFGKVYMSTVGCGIIWGAPKGTQPAASTKPATTTQPIAATTKTSALTAADTTAAQTASGSGNVTTTVPGKWTVWGDANCDDKLTVSDAILVARIAAEDKNAKITEQGKDNADVDGKAGISAEDVTVILQQLAGLR